MTLEQINLLDEFIDAKIEWRDAAGKVGNLMITDEEMEDYENAGKNFKTAYSALVKSFGHKEEV